MSQTQCPKTKIRGRVTDDAQAKLDRVNGLVDDDVAKVKLNKNTKTKQ